MFISKIKELGYKEPTAVQKEVFSIYESGKDIVAIAPTGSGKTLAFVVPIVLTGSSSVLHTLIITPTRELAKQIESQIKILKSNQKVALLIGGLQMQIQLDALKSANIAIATPGRLIDLLTKNEINLNKIKNLVLDEADRMLDMGFKDEVLNIINHLPSMRQNLLFLATTKDSTMAFAKSLLKEPIIIDATKKSKPNIKEYYLIASSKERSLKDALAHFNPQKSIIFCQTKEDTKTLYGYLKDTISCTLIHGNLTQEERFENLTLFTNGSRRVLIATDLASRGLDIDDLSLVVNFDLPQKVQTYIHRIGRSGRANKIGVALNIIKSYQQNSLKELAPNAKLLELNLNNILDLEPIYETIKINAGKKRKIRKADIIGTLCKELNIDIRDIGKVDIDKDCSYIAIKKELAKDTSNNLNRIKKQKIKAWIVR